MESGDQTSSKEPEAVKKPKLWRYLVVFLILAVLWIVMVELVIRPRILAGPGATVPKKLAIYLVPPFLTAALAYGLRCLQVRRKVKEQEEQLLAVQVEEAARRREEESRKSDLLKRKRFSLEILGCGVAVEYLRHEEVWEEIQGAEARQRVLSEDSGDYPDTAEEKEQARQEREVEVLDRVLGWLSDEWAVPTFIAGPELVNVQMQALLESDLVEALSQGEVQGRRLNVVDTLHEAAPDALVQTVFQFLEENPEIPAALLVAEDGLVLRNALREEGLSELLEDGPRNPDEPAESVVALLIGKKSRLDSMRATLPDDVAQEDVFKPFWEKEQASRSAESFRTSEWLPRAWSGAQIKRFLDLPVLGRLHRPQQVVFQGSGEASRAGSLMEAWQEALATLPEEEPSEHLIYDAGPVTQGRRVVPLARAAATLDPDFDVIDRGVDLHLRLGDTGAAAPLLGLALAAMAGQSAGGVSISTFLRREEGASLWLVSPPQEGDAPVQEAAAEDELAYSEV